MYLKTTQLNSAHRKVLVEVLRAIAVLIVGGECIAVDTVGHSCISWAVDNRAMHSFDVLHHCSPCPYFTSAVALVIYFAARCKCSEVLQRGIVHAVS